MQALAEVSETLGDGFIELTGRGNVQLRGITDVDAVAQLLTAAELVPSTSHEKVRNIEVSSATGRVGGLSNVWPLATALDAALRAEPSLSSLSGRFLFGIDDGRTDIALRRPDVCAVLRLDREALVVEVLVDGITAGTVHGVRLAPGDDLGAVADTVIAPLLATAGDMVEISAGTKAWRIRDLDDSARNELLARARTRLTGSLADPLDIVTPEPQVGWFGQHDGRVMLGGVVELARIPARLAQFLAAIDAPIVITPNREILVGDLTEGVAETVVRVLAPMGLIFDAASPWTLLSCCVGAPGCTNARAEVRTDLLARIDSGEPITDREHWVGCARGCGTPPQEHVRVEADGTQYLRSHR